MTEVTREELQQVETKVQELAEFKAGHVVLWRQQEATNKRLEELCKHLACRVVSVEKKLWLASGAAAAIGGFAGGAFPWFGG